MAAQKGFTHIFLVALLVLGMVGLGFAGWQTINHKYPKQVAVAGGDIINTTVDAANVNASTNAVNSSTSTVSKTGGFISHPQPNSQPQTTSNTPLNDVSIDKVYVDKSARVMQLLSDGNIIRQYHIALGASPQGHKQQEGDEKTPEGIYTLDYKNENSIAYRSIHISYPNKNDIAHAKSLGVSPGGAIMIHGQMNGYEHLTDYFQQRDWTDGCIAVTNDEMDEIMAAVKIGTPIEIVW